MAEDVADITVAVDAAGAEMAETKLQGVEDQLGDTADEMDDTTDGLGALSERWGGAVTAIMTGLSVATAGLLSQVPVIGQTMDLLGGIIEQIALKIDSDLRPSTTGLHEDLAELQGEVADSEGTFDALDTALTGVNNAFDAFTVQAIQSKIESLTGVTVPANWLDFGLNVLQLDFEGTLDAMQNSFDDFKSDIITLAASLSPATKEQVRDFINDFTDLGGDLKDAGSGLISDFATGITNTVSKVASAAGDIAGEVSGGVTGVVDNALEWGNELVEDFATGVANLAGRVASEVGNVTGDVVTEFTDLVDDATQWAKDMIDEFVKGLKQASSRLAEGVKKHVAQTIRDHLPGSPAKVGPLSDLDQTGPGLVDTFAGGIEANVGTVESAGDSLGQAADPAGVPSQAGGDVSVFISGRQVEDGTAQYRDDAVLNRGRPQ